MSKVTFETISFRNFLSFGNTKTTINLTDPGTTLIIGENIDEGGSSGAGKTTVVNALSYVLYDKIPRDDIKKDKLINNINSSKAVTMEVELTMSVGSTRYIINRRRGHDAGIKLMKDGLDITPDSIANFNLAVEELLGFSYNLFSQIILFNGNSTAFLSLSGPQQRELIEELLRITILSRKAEALKLKMNAVDADLKLQVALIEQQRKQVERHEALIEAAKKRVADWDIQHASSISAQERTLAALQAVDFEAEEQLHKLLDEVKAKVAPIDADIAVLDQQSKTVLGRVWPKTSELALAKSDLARAEKDHLGLTKELLHLQDAKCPYCLQKFTDAQAKIAEIEAKQQTAAAKITACNEVIKELDEALSEFNEVKVAESAELAAAKAELVESKKAFAAEQTDYAQALTYKTYKDHVNAATMAKTLVSKIESMLLETNPHVDAYEALKRDSASYVPDTTKVDELSKLKEHQKVLHKLLTDKNSYIRKGIISKTLPFLNKRIAYYTERLGLPHVVLFQPDMTCEISRHGLELGHGNLSNGEQKRLNLGLCFAFRDALTYLHSKVNLLLTDEVDGGSLDEQAVSSMIQLLKHKAWDDKIGIFIISHRPEFDGRCDRNLIVRKESGFSSLVVKEPD